MVSTLTTIYVWTIHALYFFYFLNNVFSFLNKDNCGIHHVTVSIATRILIANLGQIDLSKVCLINLVYFKMQV